MDHRLPEPVRVAVDEWLDLRDREAPGVVEGLYLVGSAALDDWHAHSDVDVVAFVGDPTDDAVVERLESAHHVFDARSDRPQVDGLFLAWADVSSPPLAAQRPWSLDGELRFDGECFEINPVTWFTLATHGVAVRGPAASELAVATDDGELRTWVCENVDTYWRGVLGDVERALESDPGRDEFSPVMQVWCALGIARMAYTYDTADVISKTEAGEWLIERRPAHATVVCRALAVRRDPSSAVVDRADVLALVDLLVDEVRHITGR